MDKSHRGRAGPETREAMPIAVVGLGCRLPGGASSPEKLWDLLSRKQSARKETPPERFNIDAFHHPNADRNGTINNRAGHYLDEDISEFDAPFFSIAPAEALSMDPMQRILLEVVYEATENAGISISQLAGTDTSCYVGCFTSDYDQIAKRDPETLPKYHSIGTGQAILSNRISFCFDLKGPSVTLDTACSSSLVAVHLACQSLRTGESKTAIVGATHAILNPDVMVGMTNLHFLSPDSKCYTFDSRANGYARGEGVAALILKPLEDAIRDGDTVRAVIRGTAVNSNGKAPGITLPSREAQARLIRSAYDQAGCDPSVTGYCESHGTGTAAGDPIEAGAIGDALGVHRADGQENKLYVGSIKTNIGHLEGASGLAGLIKTVMSLEKGYIAPNLWFEKGNPNIDFDAWRIRVPTDVTPWPVTGLRRASVNGFGYGGTNGHVILDDAYHYMLERGLHGNHNTARPSSLPSSTELLPEIIVESSEDSSSSLSRAGDSDQSSLSSNSPAHSEDDGTAEQPRPRVFLVAGHESAAVINSAKSYSKYITSRVVMNEDAFLDDLAFTMCERRSRLDCGSAVVASSRRELVENLDNLGTVIQRSSRTPGIGYVFTGQGAQWWAMGRELFQYPVFTESLAACDRAVRAFGSTWSLTEELLKDQKSSRINEAEISQPLCSALQIGLVDLLASWSIHPNHVVGHSSGEIAAAYATGALSLESAMRVAYFRGLLSPKIKTLGFKGGMMAAGLSEIDALKEISDMGDDYGKIAVACINSPRSVTLSGDMNAISQIQKILTSKQIFARKLQVETAYHSHHMLAIADEYRDYLADLEVAPWEKRKQVTMFSSVTGLPVTSEVSLAGSYWVDNMVSCVRFSDALTSLCKDKESMSSSVDLLVELGPHSALAGPIKQTLSETSGSDENTSSQKYLSAILRGKDAAATALLMAGSLFAQGYPTDLHTANFAHASQKSSLAVLTDLPTYSWNRTRKYWSESRISRDYRMRPFPRSDILGAPSLDWNPLEPRWRNIIRLSEQPWIRSHVVQGATVYPAAGYCCMALEAAAQISTLDEKSNEPVVEYRIKDLVISRALVIPQSDDGVEVNFSMHPRRPENAESQTSEAEFRVFSYTADGGWADHCRGVVSITYGNEGNSLTEVQSSVAETQKNCYIPLHKDDLYAGLDASGLYYGPEFQGISQISFASSTFSAFSTVQVTDTASAMPLGFEYDRRIHPATLDTFLQMSIVAISNGSMSNLKQPYVPTSVDEITIPVEMFAPIGKRFNVASSSSKNGSREILSSVVATAEDGQPALRMKGITLVAIASTNETAGDVPSHCATAVWEPDVDLLGLDDMNAVLRQSVTADQHGSRLRDLELVAYYYFDRVLNEISEQEISHMHSHHQKFMHYMKHQRDMVLANRHEQQDSDWLNLDAPHMVNKIQSLISTLNGEDDYEGRMFVRIGEALVSILRKQVEPLALMMKDNLLHNYYTVALGTQGTYPQIARYVSLLSHKYPNLEYLEIGAGTGGCTTPVLEALSGAGNRKYPRMKSYTYTDISSGFFEQAAEKFSNWSSMMEFAKLDVEKDPDSQPGFANRQFDVIVAANVLHATYDIQRTMKHTRKLLRPGGKLILLDMTHSVMAVSLIFGNLSGWWNCSEPWREYGPLLNECQWRDVLRDQRFSDLQGSAPDNQEALEEQTRVIIASAIEQEPEAVSQPAETQVLIVTPDHDNGDVELLEKIKMQLSEKSVRADVCSLTEAAARDLSKTAVVSLCELNKPLIMDISPENLSALRSIVRESAGIIWVTRGGLTKGVHPELSLFSGLARSLRAERELTPCITVDLDPQSFLTTESTAQRLVEVYQQGFSSESAAALKVIDREFSEENGVFTIKRAIENTRLNQLIANQTKSTPVHSEQQDIWRSSRPLQARIDVAGPGTIAFDDAVLSVALPDDHVQIEVRAVSLNTKRIIANSGNLSEGDLSNECSGVVSKVGRTVSNIAVGDRVAGWSPNGISTLIELPAACTQKLPDDVTFTSGATFPLSSVAAKYGLVNAARIEKSSSILVHSAASVMGRAVVEIAKCFGAKLVATFTSDAERKLLIEEFGLRESQTISSQTSSLGAALYQTTGDASVDVIFDCSTDVALKSAHEVMSPFGCFIHTGGSKKTALAMPNNVTIVSIDAGAMFEQNPRLAGKLFEDAMKLIGSEMGKATSAVTERPVSELQKSVRQIQEGKISTTVVEFRANDLVSVVPKSLQKIKFTEDGSYLLSGGLGGLGRSISRWMAQNGAKNFIFISRRGASTSEAKQLLEDLTAAGARAEVLQCDITDEDVLSDALSTTLSSMPPLRGVIQAAMELKDQMFANMTYEAFADCIRPKVHGSRSLHNVTLQQPLDFFLLLSSCASFWGNAGQSNYAAGCNYQVALAAHRRALGLPATAIDIGKVANVGFVAENAGSTSERNLIKLGLLDVSEQELLAMLELAMLPASNDTIQPGSGGNIPNGHFLTGLDSSNDPDTGAELPFWSRDPVFAHMDFVRPHIRAAKKAAANGGAPSSDENAQKQQPLSVSLPTATCIRESDAFVLDALLMKLSRSLMMPVEDLDAKKPTSAYGVDSLIAVELRNWFSREAKVEVPVFEVLQAPSLAQLANKVTTKSPLVSFKE